MLKKNEAAPGDGAAPDDEHTENYNNFEPVSQRRYNLLDERVFNAFYKRWEIIEIRIIGAYGNDQLWEGYARGTVAGYFDDRDIFLSVVRALALSQKKYNVYFTLQIPDPRLIGRADNRLRANIQTTSDNNVRFYRWIPIDCDPVRPAGISASETELARAILLRNQIRDFILMTCDFKHVVTAVSGNGGHVLIKLNEDRAVNAESIDYIKRFIERVSERFSTDQVDVDTTVYNPARIWKLYGTKAMKGDEVAGNQYREAQVHRESYIDDMGGLL